MTTIFLYGEMAEKFGPVWRLAVSSVGEAIRAIEANRPGLIAYLEESAGRGVDFNVKVNGVDTVAEDALRARRKIESIQISPVVRGSKDAWVQVVIGAVLIAVAVFAPGMQGLAFGIEGLTWGAVVGGMGIGMALGGIAQMIAGTPKMGSAKIDDSGKGSSLFNGPENVTMQGGPVPICYGGPIIVGSRVVSAGIHTEDTTVAPTYTTGGGNYVIDGPYVNAAD